MTTRPDHRMHFLRGQRTYCGVQSLSVQRWTTDGLVFESDPQACRECKRQLVRSFGMDGLESYFEWYRMGREWAKNRAPQPPPTPPPIREDKIASALIVEAIRQLPEDMRRTILSDIVASFCVCGGPKSCRCWDDS